MTTTIDYNGFKSEIAFFLRNNNVFSVSHRGVSTTVLEGSLTNVNFILISSGLVKNVRSVVVAGVTKVYGVDYFVDVDFVNSGVINAKIVFFVNQTGAFIVSYDFGDDKIWTDIPQRDTVISDFPIIGMQVIGEDSDDNDLSGESQLTSISVSVVVYGPSVKAIDDYVSALKALFIANKKSFFLNTYLKPIGVGPVLPFGPTSNKIFQRNIDLISQFNEEFV